MFEEIDSVDWAKLSHSHGNAEEVPTRLMALTAGPVDARRKALDYFWEYMLHQGSRYEASPYVVRFLFEALEEAGCLIQRELIDILLALGVGYGESFLPFGYDIEEEERRFKRNQWGGVFDYDDARSAYYEVHQRAEAFTKYLLPENHPETRLSAAFAVAHFAQPLNSFSREVELLIKKEQHPSQLQSLMLCFGMLGRYAERKPDANCMMPHLGPGSSKTLRVTSSIALATMLGSEIPDSARQILITCLAESWDVSSPRQHWQWWNKGDLLGYAALVLRLLGSKHREKTVRALCEALTTKEACTFALPETLLDLLFPPPKPANGWKVADFDDLQRESLRVFLRTRHWRDWMISPRFLPSGLTGDKYRLALKQFMSEILGSDEIDLDSKYAWWAGNVSSWDLKKYWPKEYWS